ncbi:MAG: hypothetical protein E7312_08670 [Clostridiales bacterium]|nr:hypothetical protein [Clostridiales bacterium]
MKRKSAKKTKTEKLGLIKNILLIILSFLISVALWFMGTFKDQTPVTRQLIDIPVTIVGENVLTDKNLYFNDIGDIKVNATIKGVSTAIFSVKIDEIVAVIDVSSYASGEYSVYPTLQNIGTAVTTTKIDSVDIVIEDIVTNQLDIALEVEGKPVRGYEARPDLAEYESTVSVTCKASIMEKIAGARIKVNVDGKRTAVTTTTNVELLDIDGNVINDPGIKLSVESVSVRLPISLIELN